MKNKINAVLEDTKAHRNLIKEFDSIPDTIDDVKTFWVAVVNGTVEPEDLIKVVDKTTTIESLGEIGLEIYIADTIIPYVAEHIADLEKSK